MNLIIFIQSSISVIGFVKFEINKSINGVCCFFLKKKTYFNKVVQNSRVVVRTSKSMSLIISRILNFCLRKRRKKKKRKNKILLPFLKSFCKTI